MWSSNLARSDLERAVHTKRHQFLFGHKDEQCWGRILKGSVVGMSSNIDAAKIWEDSEDFCGGGYYLEVESWNSVGSPFLQIGVTKFIVLHLLSESSMGKINEGLSKALSKIK